MLAVKLALARQGSRLLHTNFIALHEGHFKTAKKCENIIKLYVFKLL